MEKTMNLDSLTIDDELQVRTETGESLPEVVRKKHDPKCTCCRNCWPGKFGMIETAKKLSKRLSSPIRTLMPPDGAKGLRGWLSERMEAVGVCHAIAEWHGKVKRPGLG